MTSIELAIAIPIELSKYSQFNILPYSADKIIKSILEKMVIVQMRLHYLNI